MGGNEAESSGDGVDEDRITLLDFVRFVHERNNGGSLQEACSASSGVDTRLRRDREDLVPRDSDVLRVSVRGVLADLIR